MAALVSGSFLWMKLCKQKKFTFWAYWIFTLMMVAGCVPSTPNPVMLSSKTSAEPTNTIIPTLTAKPSLTPTHTPAPLPTDTPTPIPTLPVEQAQAKLLELLSSNGNCLLPCLWGITPGKSNYQEAKSILLPISSLSKFTHLFPSPGSIDPKYIEGDREIITNLSYSYAGDGIVDSISFHAREFQVGEPGNPYALKPIYDSKTFGERLRPYMLSSFLTQYGIPEAILISTDGGYDRGRYVPGFDIVLIYPDQGIMAAYTTYRQLVNGKVRGCPANAHVEMQLTPAGQPDFFAKIISQTQWGNVWPIFGDNPYWKSVEEAISMTPEQFYETFREPTEKCVETPVNFWPTLEP